MRYLPLAPDDEKVMLDAVGVNAIDDLFEVIPDGIRAACTPDVPTGVSDPELHSLAGHLASLNTDATTETCFMGFGTYDHFVPDVCKTIPSRSEFQTAYTPYQPEISQGTLQAIFEYQTCVSELTGLPVSNASLYDGSTAVAEAVQVAVQVLRKSHVVLVGTIHPHSREVIETLSDGYGTKITIVPYDETTGTVRVADVEAAVQSDTVAVVVQQPNVFGLLEDAPAICSVAKEAGAAAIVSCDPISLGFLEAPGAYGADIVVGDGQALGTGLNFGGPSFGFFAADQKYLRRLPGRIVGETTDSDGRRGWVLTLQTREQHIRREKATSNICTNQALCALTGLVYLTWLGASGLQELAQVILSRMDLLRREIRGAIGITEVYEGSAFKELLVSVDAPVHEVVAHVRKHEAINPGVVVEDHLLIAVTEKRTDDEIKRLVRALQAAVAEIGGGR